YSERTVQDFLQKPKSRFPEKGPVKEAWHDSASLRMRNAFLATNNFDSLRLVGGFEFRCQEKEAENVIERWKSRLLTKAPGTERSSADYEKHHIDILSGGRFTFASTIAGHEFLPAATAAKFAISVSQPCRDWPKPSSSARPSRWHPPTRFSTARSWQTCSSNLNGH